MKCLRCNRELTDPTKTIGDVCRKKALKESETLEKKIRIEPGYKSAFYRSYYVFTTPRRWVKVYVNRETGERSADCECMPDGGAVACQHIAAVADLDYKLFPRPVEISALAH